jgi:hypothetical protein
MVITKTQLRFILKEYLEKQWKEPRVIPPAPAHEPIPSREDFELLLSDMAFDVEEAMHSTGSSRKEAVEISLRKAGYSNDIHTRGHLNAKLTARGIQEGIATPGKWGPGSSDVTGEYDYDDLEASLSDEFYRGGMGTAHIDDLLSVVKNKFPLIWKDDKLKMGDNPESLTSFQKALDNLGASLDGSSGYYQVEDTEEMM